MIKELSKQLCELCGVEGKIKKQELTIVNGEIIDKFEYRIYPDFGKPNNFVKLFNLEFNSETDTIAYFVLQSPDIYLGAYTIKDFLKTLHYLLDIEVYWSKEVKQAIKNTQWEY